MVHDYSQTPSRLGRIVSQPASLNRLPLPSPPLRSKLRRLPFSIFSIRYVVTFWYVGMLAVILGVFSGVLYTTVSSSLTRDVNKALSLSSRGIADSIFSFWRAERASATGPGNWENAPADTFIHMVNAGKFPVLLSRWNAKTHDLQGGDHPTRILSHSGKVLVISRAFEPEEFSLTDELLARFRVGQDVYETVQGHGKRLRLLTHPVNEKDSTLYLIQVAAPLSQIDASLARLRLWLFLLNPFTLLLTSMVGWFLASRALHPVGRMIRQAKRIGVGRWHERVDVSHTGDELEELAVTFNELLTRIEETFRHMRRFSAAASHELRTPLTAMKGELEVALRRPRASDEYVRVLEAQLDALNEMIATVEELLTLARKDATYGVIDQRPVDCAQLVREAGQIWARLGQAKQVRVDTSVQESLWVIGEQRLLERLLANLLDNALRHTPSGGSVTLKADCADDKICITVRDTGAGIAPEDMPHLFDRFFQPRTSGNGKTTGLGLGLCQWIAEAHHGSLEVTSRPHEGAMFTVWLQRHLPPTSGE